MSAHGEGIYRDYFSDGALQFEISYREGKLNGVMRRWAQNGRLILECGYADDVREGRSRRWYDTGILREDAFYVDDKLEGDYIQYDAQGNVAMRAKFKDGSVVPESLSSGN